VTGVLVKTKSGVPETAGGGSGMPVLIARAGGNAEKRFLEFFAAQIRNRNTREAYLRAVRDFLDWAEFVWQGQTVCAAPRGSDARTTISSSPFSRAWPAVLPRARWRPRRGRSELQEKLKIVLLRSDEPHQGGNCGGWLRVMGI
jgi:hypothetical protein